MNNVKGKRVAILVADNFEQVEMTEPRKALAAAGVSTFVVSPVKDQVKGVHHDKPGDTFKVDIPLDDARADQFDMLMLPGGLMSPDALRMDEKAIRLVLEFYRSGKPIAAICHGPWLLAEAGIAGGAKLTSWPAIKTDMRNAGAEWIDEEVVVDQGIVTSRSPNDIPAFNSKMLEELGEGIHARHAA
jgi:protease I